MRASDQKPTFLEFFAGSGLVAEGISPHFEPIWANDLCEKKAAVYHANHGSEKFVLGDIANINGMDLPNATLSWASFPCQDLSLAGLSAGIHGKRSGLVWQWLRIMDEMPKRPKILVAENVTGLVSTKGGEYYHILHKALTDRGYNVGAVVLDAAKWVPQSRKRVFIIAVERSIKIPDSLQDNRPNWAHSIPLINTVKSLNDFIWWKMPIPAKRKFNVSDIIEWNAPADNQSATEAKLNLLPTKHHSRLYESLVAVAPGYRRTRNGKQVLELRFDGIAGCLRTAQGGSSRQVLVIKHEENVKTRLLTVREAARLMGAPDTYKIPGSYNDGYTAMGDAVALPVSRYLSTHILEYIAKEIN